MLRARASGTSGEAPPTPALSREMQQSGCSSFTRIADPPPRARFGGGGGGLRAASHATGDGNWRHARRPGAPIGRRFAFSHCLLRLVTHRDLHLRFSYSLVIMVSELFSSLAARAPPFAAMLFIFLLKRRSREINAAANDGTAGGAMATSSGYDYDVFLSFSGQDTRTGFTDFLYTSLVRLGIRTFKDDKELHVGEDFPPNLLQAIKQSKISIPIFSKGYASSVWCLQELAQMVECQKIGRQKIMPIFYDVAPSEVRHQIKDYAKAFLSHERKGRYGEETICQWKAALSFVGDINGWDVHSETNRREGEFAERVAREVFSGLQKANLVVSDCLVRVDNHVNAIMKKIGALTSETQIIGVHGMGGIGKTTIAKMIYNELSKNFEHCCFLSNIREMSERKGIEFLQDQLIFDILKGKLDPIRNIDDGITKIKERLRTKKVLLLLDDVDDKKHMDALAGERNWFGTGSKLIITTRNKEVLEMPLVDDFYQVNGMNDVQALELFSKHAFQIDSPLFDYTDQSKKVIKIASGLPLALEVIGSLLRNTEKKMWDATLKMLESVPHDEVQNKLRISYDALDFRQKRIFLDIACLFFGHDKDILVHFWDESIFFPKKAMIVLQSMSLIKIDEDNRVWMHDQLRDLGREIVRERSDTKIEKQSRVWDAKEGLNLLRRKKGKKRVEALCLMLDPQWPYHFTYEGFESLSEIRYLEVDSSMKEFHVEGFESLSDIRYLEEDSAMEEFHVEERPFWHELPSNVPPPNENSDLLPQLRWLSWCNIPPTFNITNFLMEEVVILNLSNSEITDDWKGWSHVKVTKNLKVLDLSCCRNIKSLPDELGKDFSGLEYLYLKECNMLGTLPNSMGELESLIELDISGTWIEELPDAMGNLKSLKVLKMDGSRISKMPNAIWTIEKLEEIEVSRRDLGMDAVHVEIGNCINRNKSLRILRLNDAKIHSLERLPESLITLELRKLYMDTFPDISNLANLKKLALSFHSRDSAEKYPVPRWIGNLRKLESLYLRSSLVTTLPNLSLPSHLKSLRLRCCNLRSLPRLPSRLSSLCLDSCVSLCSLGDLSNLKKLSSLRISNAAITEIQDLGCLKNIQDLELQYLDELKMLSDLHNLNKLRRLQVSHCGNLLEILGKLPQSLEELHMLCCESLQKLPDLSSLNALQIVAIYGCMGLNLKEISSICSEKSVECFVTEEYDGIVCGVQDDSEFGEEWDSHIFEPGEYSESATKEEDGE